MTEADDGARQPSSPVGPSGLMGRVRRRRPVVGNDKAGLHILSRCRRTGSLEAGRRHGRRTRRQQLRTRVAAPQSRHLPGANRPRFLNRRGAGGFLARSADHRPDRALWLSRHLHHHHAGERRAAPAGRDGSADLGGLCRQHRQHQHRRRGGDRGDRRHPGGQCRLLGRPPLGPAAAAPERPPHRPRPRTAQARPVSLPPARGEDRVLRPLHGDATRLCGGAGRSEQARCAPLHGVQRAGRRGLGRDHGLRRLPVRAVDRERHGAGGPRPAGLRPARGGGAVAVHAPARGPPDGRRRGRDPGPAHGGGDAGGRGAPGRSG